MHESPANLPPPQPSPDKGRSRPSSTGYAGEGADRPRGGSYTLLLEVDAVEDVGAERVDLEIDHFLRTGLTTECAIVTQGASSLKITCACS